MFDFKQIIRNGVVQLNQWLLPTMAAGEASPKLLVDAMMERHRFHEILAYRDFDETSNFLWLDPWVSNSKHTEPPSIGFMVQYSPLMVAGTSAEASIETAITHCPTNSVVQFGVLATNQVMDYLDAWTESQLRDCKSNLLRQIALRRREFFRVAGRGEMSLLPYGRLYPREFEYYASVRIPYTGDVSNYAELDIFVQRVAEIRSNFKSALAALGMAPSDVTKANFQRLMREILNPQFTPEERIKDSMPGDDLSESLCHKEGRIWANAEGWLNFGKGPVDSKPTVVACITVDKYPDELWLPATACLLGDPLSRDERISCPFWAYTTIHVLDPDNAKDALNTKFGLLNRQTGSTSSWMASMTGYLNQRKNNIENLLSMVGSSKHQLIRAYSGINLYSARDDISQDVENVKAIWRKVGFRASPEKLIPLPAFMASLPLQFTPSMDPGKGRGLQRMSTIHSGNAAAACIVQGDWKGHDPSKGGPLVVSRRGQLASVNLLESSTNYNFVVVAESGSGKSFFVNEIARDFLARKGLVRILDVGRSYEKFCREAGGQFMVFEPSNPKSLNPFTGVVTQEAFHELLPLLKDLVRQMAYPLTPETDVPPWEYSAIEQAIDAAWAAKNEKADMVDVYDWLAAHADERAQDLAFQLQPYAKGRFAAWFTGKREMGFDNDLVVIELEELKNDKELRSVILTLAIHQISKEMYLVDPDKRLEEKRPKMLLIDEAWDLFADVRTASFIESAFRRVRKYNGIAGVVTQKFDDFERSPAAQAAITNAAWVISMGQAETSIAHAFEKKYIVGSEYTKGMIRTVRSASGAFSELYIQFKDKGGNYSGGIFRFIVDKHSHLLYTTNAAETNQLGKLMQSGLSLEAAVDTYARALYKVSDNWRDWEPAPLPDKDVIGGV